MTYILLGLLATNAAAIIAAIVFRHQRDAQRKFGDACKAEAQREAEARRLAEVAHKAAASRADALTRMVERERSNAAVRVEAERKAAASAAHVNRRAQQGDPSALRAALDDLEARR